jgi:predicted nuclease of restriction endonuclease-like (RecB) superfamily
MNQILDPSDQQLIEQIKEYIEQSRKQVISIVNQALIMTYWHIGKIINTQILQQQRADYGKEIIKRLSEQLIKEYGNGYSKSNLIRMVNFYQQFDNVERVATLSQQLSWSHFIELLKLKNTLQQDFYITMCQHERWSVRVLRERMNSMLFERTALANQPEELIRQELANLEEKKSPNPQLFLKDPYLLDFLQLGDAPSEKQLENAILQELQQFILEFGSDFAFMARQKRVQIGNNDYYMDLLFYHRSLKRLVLIELKLGEFKPEYKGQVELYLKWLEKNEKRADENPPIAIILCATKDDEVIELMDLDKENIHVSEYWLKLPSEQQLRQRLHLATEKALLMQEQTSDNT